MDYLRKEFLAAAAFAGDEHREVDGSYAQGTAHSLRKGRSGAYDAESGFGLLNCLCQFK